MTLRLYDTATREVADFVPLQPGRVGVYVCGATVQGAPHIGHMRTIVAFDVLHRWLERQGLSVTMIRNVTDINEKIFVRAADAGMPWWAWAFRFEREFSSAYDALGCLPATYEPRATGHVLEMVALTQTLVERGHAYESAGSVYFDVRSYPAYGELTNQGLESLEAADDAPEKDKRDPHDFALWKAAKDGDPDDAVWPSPWGPGRPGWHLECSAMARRYLGAEFDIHGGGLDLRFPHHENELAQSRAAGDPFARVWMHSAWVTMAGEKMSKSLGNTALVSEVVGRHTGAAVRLALAGVHYRSTIEYSEDVLDGAEATWARLDGFVRRASEVVGAIPAEEVAAATLPPAFVAAMDDDLAVPRALAVVHASVTEGNCALSAGDAAGIRAALLATRAMLGVLGLDPEDPQWRVAGGDRSRGALEALVGAELEAREAARAAGQWAIADGVRDRLSAAGVVVEDSPSGARWSLPGDV